MFFNIKNNIDVFIYYYKFFVLNQLWKKYLNNQITFGEYYEYNQFYFNQIQFYNFCI